MRSRLRVRFLRIAPMERIPPKMLTYEPPRLLVHGTVEALTMNGDTGQGGGLDCKLRGANGYKDNYGVDLNTQANQNQGLGTCSP
jgi:hypothetical protein